MNQVENIKEPNVISEKKFILGKEPFIRKADSSKYGTDVIMRDLMIALLPLIIFAWVKNGLLPFINNDTTSVYKMLYPLIFVFMGGFSCWFFEFVAYKYFLKEKDVLKKLRHSFPIIPGVLLAMICSVNTPLWVLILGCFFATVVGKIIFGGFGNNIFNPALVGYLFISIAYSGVIKNSGGYLNPSELDIIAGVTPMTNFASSPVASLDFLVDKYGSIGNFIIGTVPGSLAETSGLLCIVGLVYLLIRKVINWRIPIIYIGTVFVLTYIVGAFNGYALNLNYALFNVFSGGLLFGAVFMATEPVTSPRTPNGKVVFALFLGVLTVLFRFRGNLPEGVATAIMTMNMFTLIIDRSSAKIRVEDKKLKICTYYGVIAILLLGLSIYGVTYKPTIMIEDASRINEQYEYVIKVDSEEVIVTTSKDKDIVTMSNKHYDTKKYHKLFSEYIIDYQIDETKAVVTDFKQDNQTLDFVFTISYLGKEITITTDQDKKIVSIPEDVKNDEQMFIDIIQEYNVYPFIKTVNDESTNLIIVNKRPRGVEITFTITFEDNKIVSITSDSKSKETYTKDTYPDWSGIHPEDVMPSRIISNQNDLSKVEIVTSATQTSNLFIDVAKLALNYVEANNE